MGWLFFHICIASEGSLAQRGLRDALEDCYASGGLFLFISKRKRKEKETKEGAFHKAAPSLETPLRNRRNIPFNNLHSSDATKGGNRI